MVQSLSKNIAGKAGSVVRTVTAANEISMDANPGWSCKWLSSPLSYQTIFSGVRCDTNTKEGFKGQGSSTWWAGTPERPGAVGNRESCWKNQAPGTHRQCCRTLFPPGQTSPSCGNLKEDKLLKRQEESHQSNIDHSFLKHHRPASVLPLIRTDGQAVEKKLDLINYSALFPAISVSPVTG